MKRIIPGLQKLTAAAVLALGSLLLPQHSQAQQQFSTTQYMNNLTTFNQTYSLLDSNASVTGLYRKQWSGIDGAPTTFMFSSALPFQNMNAAAGINITDDKIAVEHQTQITAYFAKSIQMAPNSHLAVSLDGGMRRYVGNYSSVSANDPVFANNVNETRPTLGFGVMYYTSNYYLGVSVPEINLRSLGSGSVENNTYFKNHYYFSGAYLSGQEGDDFRVKPAALVSYTNGIPTTWDLSTTLYLKETLGIGLNYRTNTEMAAIMTVNLHAIRFGYSYQFGTASNNIGNFNFATHELTLTYRFGGHNDGHKLL